MKASTRRNLWITIIGIIIVLLLISQSNSIGSNSSNNSDNSRDTDEPKGAWLTDLRYSECDFYVYINRDTRSHATDGSGFSHYLSGEGVVIYPLNGMYSSLSATWALDADWDGASADAGALLIYADERLIYSSSDIRIDGKLYEDISLNISGCNNLKIEFTRYHYLHGMFTTYGNIGRLNNIWLEPYTTPYSVQQSENIAAAMRSRNTLPESLDISRLPSVKNCQYYESGYRVEDCFGTEYANGHFDLCSYHYGSEKPHMASATFRATGNWRYFRGRFFTRQGQNRNFQISFQIFADGNLVYESGMINCETYPIDFDIDIYNADTIMIQSYSEDYTSLGTNPGIILVNAEVHN